MALVFVKVSASLIVFEFLERLDLGLDDALEWDDDLDMKCNFLLMYFIIYKVCLKKKKANEMCNFFPNLQREYTSYA